ncbi:hypothetical protein [Pseudomonas sp. CC6-YY-74]|uniref:hypothetical protein n=1 Tax=Pseudomonas sp. CC6-YY-74 TaxID=1930532 RepID=UPI0009A1E491|nr:hypothetical protein [Pseudomonas sp. CC6-YY-74]
MKKIIPLFICLLLSACASSSEALNKDLAGHYYLQGAMEMGSELLLRNDGNFEAIMDFGAAKGNWTQTGQRLTLHRQTSSPVSEDDFGQIFDGMVLHIRPNCLAIEEMDGCYIKAPARQAVE